MVRKRFFFDLHDHPELKGIPDGMTIDSSDNLWIALFGGHSVCSFLPTGLLVLSLPSLELERPGLMCLVETLDVEVIINVDSKTGHLKRVIKMPATYVTSACFGGPQLDILYVTTSKLHLTQPELENEPLAGSVFAVSNLEVKGVPSNKFILN
ncbi:hypothetical protein NQ318_012362 [Aromia moschata]|uniref:SMP-30/Gluconolactonase/LRE-like region domain-containing protein n=1 Tax=Aromia moschata TaxID=1265417 RepID=A0AAV8XM64_9CUCU|nr:hypothetical protein NQ318_012362 [Aromia moschata]